MSKIVEEKAKEPEFSSLSRHSREGSTGKEDLLPTTQNHTDSLIIIQGWFLKCLPNILLNQKKFEDRSL
jgi:hypothetical protein